jgi:hypothetical protein
MHSGASFAPTRAEQEEGPMGAMLSGIVMAVVIAVVAGVVMRSESVPSWQVYKTVNARVGDPGSNLVGPEWTGENHPGAAAGEHAASEHKPS